MKAYMTAIIYMNERETGLFYEERGFEECVHIGMSAVTFVD